MKRTSLTAALALWLALVAWVPIAAFRRPIGVLLFLVLFAAGAELLRRQTLREFPDARAGDIGERLRTWRAGRSHESTVGAPDEVGELERLSALRRSGDLSDAEFDLAKQQILFHATKGVG